MSLFPEVELDAVMKHFDELKHHQEGVQQERKRIIDLIKVTRDTWQKPAAHNYQAELTKLIAAILGDTPNV